MISFIFEKIIIMKIKIHRNQKLQLHDSRYLMRIVISIFVGLSVACSSSEDTSLSCEQVPHLNLSDSLALVNIHEKMGYRIDDWDMNDITTWNNIAVALDTVKNEYRVVSFQDFGGVFSGTIPEDFRKLTELRVLILSHGHLQGSIPSWIGELTNLIYLSISDNDVSGEIPKEIGNLRNLQYLYIRNNFVSGQLPESLGNLVNLIWMEIANTSVSGEIPESFANLSPEIALKLYHNKLSGRFPINIVKNKRYSIECPYNNITELPFDIWNDDFPGAMPDLQGNRLNGTIPEWVFRTQKWEKHSSYVAGIQQEGYGYLNFKQ